MNAREKRRSLKSAFIFSPYLSFRSFSHRPLPVSTVFIKLIIFSSLTAISLLLASRYLSPLSTFEILFISPIIYFFTEAMGAIGQGLFSNELSHPIHRSPLKSTSLSRFWGHDWNIWIQDWLRDITKNIKRGHPSSRLIAIFLLSGFFHEIMCNFPYWVKYRKSYFGTMMGYFIIQAMALWVDKKYIKHWPHLWRRLYLWVAVIVPSPLFINVPLLTFLGLGHE